MMKSILIAVLLTGVAACEDDPTKPQVETGTVTISVNTENEPGREYFVVFHRANGDAVGQATLDASGNASAEIQDGDMVSLIRQVENEWQINTITGLKIGQNIQLGRPHPSGIPPVAHTIVVDADYPTGVTSLQFGTMCASGSAGSPFPRNYDIWEACMTASRRLNFVLYAVQPTGGFSHFAYAVDVLGDPSGTTLIDLRGSWRTDWQDFNLSFANSEGVAAVSIFVDPYRDGQNIGRLRLEHLTSANAPIDIPLRLPTGLAERLHVGIRLDANGVARHIEERFSVIESMDGYQMAGMPPTLSNLAVTGADTDRPTVSWTVEGAGPGADAVISSLGWNTPDESYYYSWVIHVPPGVSSVQYPSLPDEFAETRPPADGRFLDSNIAWIDDTTIDGFDDYIQHNTEREGFDEDTGDAKLMTARVRLQ